MERRKPQARLFLRSRQEREFRTVQKTPFSAVAIFRREFCQVSVSIGLFSIKCKFLQIFDNFYQKSSKKGQFWAKFNKKTQKIVKFYDFQSLVWSIFALKTTKKTSQMAKKGVEPCRWCIRFRGKMAIFGHFWTQLNFKFC